MGICLPIGRRHGPFSTESSKNSKCGLDANLNLVGWYCYNSAGRTQPAGKKTANLWSLYDMHGNVSEWVGDRFGMYSAEPAMDPIGASSGDYRVVRGGSWKRAAKYCRSAFREYSAAADPLLRHRIQTCSRIRLTRTGFVLSGIE